MKPYRTASEKQEGTAEPQAVMCAVACSDTLHSEDCNNLMPMGRLGNSEILKNLDGYLSHLGPVANADVSSLLFEFQSIFSDVPSETTILEHDIDVGDAKAIKQHTYRVNPEKCDLLKCEVDYMLEHGIAEPSNSSWSSPCILVPKADKSTVLF